MNYRPIHNQFGQQIGYQERDSAFSLAGRLLYHIDKDGYLLRLGDGKPLGRLISEDGVLKVAGSDGILFVDKA